LNSAKLFKVVAAFAAEYLMTLCGKYGRRYLGLIRHAVRACLTFMALNLKRMVKLLTGLTFSHWFETKRVKVVEFGRKFYCNGTAHKFFETTYVLCHTS